MSKRSEAGGRWREICRRQAESGLSVAAFCRRSHIPQATFYAWRRKLRDAVAFAEVRVAPYGARRTASRPLARNDSPTRSDRPPAGGLQLLLRGGRRILVRPGFDRPTLLALVDALEQAPAEDCGEAIEDGGKNADRRRAALRDRQGYAEGCDRESRP